MSHMLSTLSISQIVTITRIVNSMTYSVLCMQSTHIGSSVHCTQENGERYFLNCILGPLKILNNQTTWNIFVPILTFYKNCTMSNLHQIADSIVNDSLMRQT